VHNILKEFAGMTFDGYVRCCGAAKPAMTIKENMF
jgi:hypothetical protein